MDKWGRQLRQERNCKTPKASVMTPEHKRIKVLEKCILEDGRETEITLLELNDNQARIGVNADMTIDIVRDELLSKIQN
jgi:hypothetical protein